MKQTFLKRTMLVAAFTVISALCAFAQNKSITGTVVDAQGSPMIGVAVMEKGTSNGTITDLDGNYVITVAQGATLFSRASVSQHRNLLQARAL